MLSISRPTAQAWTRDLARSSLKLERAIERLSTGLRVNRAADDVASLAISERLRSQLYGTRMAQRNILDGINQIRTAESGMSEIQNVLQRLREITLQAGNGIYSPADRYALQDEANALRHAIESIVDQTEFNETKLLGGTYTYLTAPTPYAEAFTRGGVFAPAPYTPPSIVDNNERRIFSPTAGNNAAHNQDFTWAQSLAGWSLDDSTIQATSTRDGGQYDYASSGSGGTPTGGGAFTRQTTRVIGADTFMITTTGGNLRMSKNGAPSVLVAGGNFQNAVFSNDGTRIAFTDNGVVYAASFNAGTMTIGPRVRVSTDADTANMPTQVVLASPVDTFVRAGDGAFSVRVEVFDALSGLTRTLAYDPTGTDGFRVAADNRTVELFGPSGVIDSNDRVRVYYQRDQGTAQIDDDTFTIQIPQIEPYQFGTAVSSLIVERVNAAGVAAILAYDPTQTNGWSYDTATGLVTIHGDARATGAEYIRWSYQGDRLASGAFAVSDLDGTWEATLYNVPELYDLTAAPTNPSIRVYVGGTEVFYDATMTNGFSYDAATNKILLHGAARPDGKEAVDIWWYRDDVALGTNQDGEVQYRLNAPDHYHLADLLMSKSLRVYVDNVEVAWDPADGYTYDEFTQILTFHGASRPDARLGDIRIRNVRDGVPDDAFQMTLPAAVVPGSTLSVTRNGVALSAVTVGDYAGNGYWVDGNTIFFVGTAAPDAAGGAVSYRIAYVAPSEALFTLMPPFGALPPPGAYPEPYAYIPSQPQNLFLINEPITVRVNGVAIAADPLNGYSIEAGNGPEVNGHQTVTDMAIRLHGTAIQPNPVTGQMNVDIDYSYLQIDQILPQTVTYQVGADQGETISATFNPMWLQSLDLNYLNLLDPVGAQVALGQIDAALRAVSTERTSLGAVENRLVARLNYGQSEMDQVLSGLSRVRDADFAVELTELVRSRMLQTGGLNVAEVVRFRDRQLLRIVTNVPPGGARVFRAMARPTP